MDERLRGYGDKTSILSEMLLCFTTPRKTAIRKIHTKHKYCEIVKAVLSSCVKNHKPPQKPLFSIAPHDMLVCNMLPRKKL